MVLGLISLKRKKENKHISFFICMTDFELSAYM